MPLKSGVRLGPYEILGPLGAGGMGEVYRARDARLDRDVAVKVLPERFLSNPEFRARFEREAKAVAALSHPNILAIHDVGVEGGVPYSVTEMLSGGTLRSLMTDSPLPLRRTLDYAIQVARGLAAAHDRGFVHRDLKPDNIFITEDGRAKILDFGLARAAAPAEDGGLTHMSTLGPGTEPGTVLGTVGYMSPEQIRAQSIDGRSDLFSFGAVLYEMLTGRRAFQADTAADTMSAILREDPPDPADSGRAVPPALDRIVRHCLEKIPAQRFQTARDLVFSLEAAAAPTGPTPAARVGAAPDRAPARRRRALALLGALLLGLAAGAGLGIGLGRAPRAEPPTLKTLTYSGADRDPSASADGRLIAYTSAREGRPQIWLKQYPGGDEVALTGGPDEFPRLSPDGSQVLFVRREGPRFALYKVAVVGGEPRKVQDDAGEGDWSPDGRNIVFVRTRAEGAVPVVGLEVTDAGGEGVREIAHVEGRDLLAPRWSPDGRTIAAIRVGTENAPNAILLVSADGKGERTLTPPPPRGVLSAVAWVGSGSSLIYAQSENIVTSGVGGGAGRIVRQEIASGRAETVMWIPSMATVVDILGAGRLLLGAHVPRQNLFQASLSSGAVAGGGHWLTRGSSIDRQPAFSPDGQWILFSSNRGGNLDLWKVATASGAVRRITEDPGDDWDPAFTPDGRSILWSASRGGHFEIWIGSADGTGARQLSRDGVDAENPTMTPDGRWVVYNSSNPASSGIWKIHPDGTDATRLVPGSWSTPEVSPDGAWVAFRSSNEPRLLQVARLEDGALQPPPIELPGHPGNGRPRWMPDGRSLVFTATDDRGLRGLSAQPFSPGRDTTSSRRALAGFDSGAPLETFGISPDGARLVYSVDDSLDSLILAEGLAGIAPPARPPR